MNKEEFTQALQEQGLQINAESLEKFDAYRRILQEWNEKMNLTAITEEGQVWEKHFYDSIVPFIGVDFETLCDVGSGAGFPGIPAAIVWPEKKFTLVEPLGKRCRFLEHVKKELHLENVEIVNARAENFAADHRAAFDAVSARAVARLSILLELCIPLLKDDGTFIALKGRSAMEELEQAAPALKELHVVCDHVQSFSLEDDAGRINLYFKKTGPTPKKYPRAYGAIKKKPLEVGTWPK